MGASLCSFVVVQKLTAERLALFSAFLGFWGLRRSFEFSTFVKDQSACFWVTYEEQQQSGNVGWVFWVDGFIVISWSLVDFEVCTGEVARSRERECLLDG